MPNNQAAFQSKHPRKWLDGTNAAWLNVWYFTNARQTALRARAATARSQSEESRLRAARCDLNPQSPECQP